MQHFLFWIVVSHQDFSESIFHCGISVVFFNEIVLNPQPLGQESRACRPATKIIQFYNCTVYNGGPSQGRLYLKNESIFHICNKMKFCGFFMYLIWTIYHFSPQPKSTPFRNGDCIFPWYLYPDIKWTYPAMKQQL